MALKSTVYKAELQIADLDRGHYGAHALTLARHPSETDERLMVRLLAWARHADAALAFGKGLSDADEPDLWLKDLTGRVALWIEVGLPDERRLLKAAGVAQQVVVYAYGGGRAVPLWWQGLPARVRELAALTVWSLAPDATTALAARAARSMRWQCTLQDGQVWLTDDDGVLLVEPAAVKTAAP